MCAVDGSGMPRKRREVPLELRPLGSRVLVKTLVEDATSDHYGHLVLPQQSADWQRYRQWEVVACGPEVLDETLLPGARIIINKLAATPVEWHGETVAFVAEDQITAVLP